MGLNLQAASIVINLDLPWNPAILEQRVGRIHRIGQMRGIEVIDLISAGTIEEEMMTKLRFKSALFEGVLDGGEDAVFLSDDKFSGLLDSLDSYMEEPMADTALIEQQEEPQATRPQAETPKEDEEPQLTLLHRLSADLADLLLADEPTRQKAAALLRAALNESLS